MTPLGTVLPASQLVVSRLARTVSATTAWICAKRALIPLENKRDSLDVSADLRDRVAPISFGDPKTAAREGLGLT